MSIRVIALCYCMVESFQSLTEAILRADLEYPFMVKVNKSISHPASLPLFKRLASEILWGEHNTMEDLD